MTVTTAGLVNAHHHLYSTLARGMPPPARAPRSFPEILELVWWRLDAALTLDDVYHSAKLGALEALECGTVEIWDHHSSPNAVEGSLDVITDAAAEVGVRVVPCYEVTDRAGPDVAKAALAENERFVRERGGRYVGAHACTTLSDATLEAVAGLAADLGVGVHVHVAEDLADHEAGQRLEPFATDTWLLAHCVHLDRPLPGTIAPRSNMNNGVGYARPANGPIPDRVVLGTDGIGGDVLEEFRVAYARHREDDVVASPETAWSWVATDEGPSKVTWSAVSVDPWHLAYTPGVRALRVEAAGDVLLDDGVVTRVDPHEVRAKAWEQARSLWSRL